MIGMALGWLVGIGLLAAVVWLVIVGLRPSAPSESPEAILKRRYAAGEIDTKEYETRLEKLHRGGNTA